MKEKTLSFVDKDQLINDICDAIKGIQSYTPKVGVFGSSGVGKSSLCNALFGKDVAPISDVEACTRKPQEILIGTSDGKSGIVLVDVPGIGEDQEHHREYTELYKSIVPELDLVLWAIKADDRSYASGLDAYKSVFGSESRPPVIFVITQTDKISDADDWDRQEYKPGGTQIHNITEKEHDVSRRFEVSTKNIISVAVSKKGKSYNLMPLIDLIVDVLPNEKKYSFTREAKEENVSDEAKKNAAEGIWQSIKNVAGEAWDSVKNEIPKIIVAHGPKLIALLGIWLKRRF
ncbi:GTPase family protein [Azospirillum sp. A23]|uniref:GTPase family protein n=1 Tax=Azospirillum sp. A23 TaxID=3160608 RepID=UPI0036F38F42